MQPAQIGVIFDCDGTLLDSMEAWHKAEDELARRAGTTLTKQDSDCLTTLTLLEAGAFFHDKFGLGKNDSDVVNMLDALLLAYYRTQAHERPGALAFVRGLAERGVVMSVASSSPQSYLQAGLACAGFSPYLRAVVSVDDVGASKREPAVYDRARELMGTSKQTTWVFEDSAYALRTLRAADYLSIGIYDCDLAGTYEELATLSDMTVRGFGELSVEEFLDIVNRNR